MQIRHLCKTTSPTLERQCSILGNRLAVNPALAERNYLGGYELSIPVPVGWRLRMNRSAERIMIKISEDGLLYGLSECCHSISGGWSGSCVPRPLLEWFLREWIEISSGRNLQLDLFGD